MAARAVTRETRSYWYDLMAVTSLTMALVVATADWLVVSPLRGDHWIYFDSKSFADTLFPSYSTTITFISLDPPSLLYTPLSLYSLPAGM
ncbi:hypothetical protein EYF80_059137 [Liparis tanakae]|uniref:Uncharacterized protein n=1 Tax=Liparis tanakae TaxID=230148 RepID=A0A4Z2EQ70_9TELE|nr:hypothetical protein EYF80_059137 [Liparis tanakae]